MTTSFSMCYIHEIEETYNKSMCILKTKHAEALESFIKKYQLDTFIGHSCIGDYPIEHQFRKNMSMSYNQYTTNKDIDCLINEIYNLFQGDCPYINCDADEFVELYWENYNKKNKIPFKISSSPPCSP
jgi:hypothetical protein